MDAEEAPNVRHNQNGHLDQGGHALAGSRECSFPDWRLVRDLDRCGVDREIRKAGWTFFCLAGEIRATVFGIDEGKMVRRTIEEILARPRLEKFNSLGITRVASEASKRFLGVRYVTVFAQPGHIMGPARSAAA